MTYPSSRPQPAALLVDRENRPSNLRPIGDLQWLQRIQRAVEKARRMTQKAWRLDVITEKHGELTPVFTVRSVSVDQVWYLQYVYESGISCTCEAGRRFTPCWHAARVALRLCREYRPFKETDLPSSPYELFDGDEWQPGDDVARTLDLPSLIEWQVLPSICTACGCEGEPGAVRCDVCGREADEPCPDYLDALEYNFDYTL